MKITTITLFALLHLSPTFIFAQLTQQVDIRPQLGRQSITPNAYFDNPWGLTFPQPASYYNCFSVYDSFYQFLDSGFQYWFQGIQGTSHHFVVPYGMKITSAQATMEAFDISTQTQNGGNTNVGNTFDLYYSNTSSFFQGVPKFSANSLPFTFDALPTLQIDGIFENTITYYSDAWAQGIYLYEASQDYYHDSWYFAGRVSYDITVELDLETVSPIWLAHYGTSIASIDITADADNDGATNLCEALLGTDPRNPMSKAYLEINGSQSILSWHGVQGIAYMLEKSQDLQNWSDFNTQTYYGEGAEMSVGFNYWRSPWFYRLKAAAPKDTDGDGLNDYEEGLIGSDPTVADTVNRWIATGSGNWNVPSNWSLGHVPTATERVILDNGNGVSDVVIVEESVEVLSIHGGENLYFNDLLENEFEHLSMTVTDGVSALAGNLSANMLANDTVTLGANGVNAALRLHQTSISGGILVEANSSAQVTLTNMRVAQNSFFRVNGGGQIFSPQLTSSIDSVWVQFDGTFAHAHLLASIDGGYLSIFSGHFDGSSLTSLTDCNVLVESGFGAATADFSNVINFDDSFLQAGVTTVEFPLLQSYHRSYDHGFVEFIYATTNATVRMPQLKTITGVDITIYARSAQIELNALESITTNDGFGIYTDSTDATINMSSLTSVSCPATSPGVMDASSGGTIYVPALLPQNATNVNFVGFTPPSP